MKRNILRFLWFVAALLLAAPSRSFCADSTALEHLQASIASLQQVLRDRNLAGDERLFQRRKAARIVLEQLFDFQEMSRRSLGANARRYSDRLGEFTPLFVDFLHHAYMGTLEENSDAKIQYVREIVGDQNVEIHTKAILKDGRDYRVDYKLHPNPTGWRVYDVSVEGISLINNYRSQFDRILSKKSFDDLLQEMRDRKANFKE